MTWARDAVDKAGAISQALTLTRKRIPGRITKVKAAMEERRALSRRTSTLRNIEYVMETPSNEDELVQSENGDFFFGDKEEEYIGQNIDSENTVEDIKDGIKSSAQGNKRSPLAGAALGLITDLVKSGKDISTARVT